MYLTLKLLLVSKRTPLEISTPIHDIVSRFFDQPLCAEEKNTILRNTANYIAAVFHKNLPQTLIHEVSVFIPAVMGNLPAGTELATFSFCFQLANLVMSKGGANSFFAKRRLIICFKAGIASPMGYFPSDAVVRFAKANSDSLEKDLIPSQLGRMFTSMFRWNGSLVDPDHIAGCLDTLIGDCCSSDPMLANHVHEFFPHFVSFMGRCDDLGVTRIDVMVKMAHYAVLQCNFARSQWSHINAPRAVNCVMADAKLSLHYQAAKRLRMLTWIMLELASRQDADLTIEAKHVESLVGTVVAGLDTRTHLGMRDAKALLQALSALKALFYFTQVNTGSTEVLVPVWMRIWKGLHHLLFDSSDILREEGFCQMGAVLMLFLYATLTNLPIVKLCMPEWKAICVTIQNRCSKSEFKSTQRHKLASNILYLTGEVQHYLAQPTRQTLNKSEIRERLLVDLRCMQGQAELFGRTQIF